MTVEGVYWTPQTTLDPTNLPDCFSQVFFVEEKSMPGWSVVMKKENRSRRMCSTDVEQALGQEGSSDDVQVLTDMEVQVTALRDNNAADELYAQQTIGRRRSWNEDR